jgi:pantetheine-phosphate adenylyltransferase
MAIGKIPDAYALSNKEGSSNGWRSAIDKGGIKVTGGKKDVCTLYVAINLPRKNFTQAFKKRKSRPRRRPPAETDPHPAFALAAPPHALPSSPMRHTAIYPGSFDPVTNGHLDVIARATRLFDRVLVAVAHNDLKKPLFSSEERMSLLRHATREMPGVEVTSFGGLLVDFARQHNATVVVRGLRAISDFEFEFQMALMNRKLHSDLETCFLTPKEELTYLSSRIIKEIARLGGQIDTFVPPQVARALREKFA